MRTCQAPSHGDTTVTYPEYWGGECPLCQALRDALPVHQKAARLGEELIETQKQVAELLRQKQALIDVSSEAARILRGAQ